MSKAPSFDEIFAVMSAASVGDVGARVDVRDDAPLDSTETKFALALNILLDDLALRGAAAQRMADQRGILSAAAHEFSAATSDTQRLLDTVARRSAVVVRDLCAIQLLSEDQRWLHLLSVHAADEDTERLMRRLYLEPALLEKLPISQLVHDTGEPFVLANVDLESLRDKTTPRFFELLKAIGARSLLVLPLRVQTQPLGQLLLLRCRPESAPFDENDLALASGLANHAARAIENARSYAAEKAARAVAEKAQEDLLASEARYRLMFEKGPLPKWVFDLDTLSFLAVNDAAIRHYGYTREEFLRMTIKDIRPAEDATLVEAALARGTPVESTQKWRHRKKDGSLITVEISAHDFALDGKRARLVLANDVTARERTEELLRKSEARFARLSESGILGIIVFDVAGRILEANDTFLKMVGFTREELQRGMVRVQDITAPEHREAVDANIERTRQHQRVGVVEEEYLRRDGSRVPVLAGGAMLDSERIVSFILDISERRQLEQVSRQAFELETQNRRIQEATRLKSEFLANMSHELRTPLNAILGFGELLQDDVVPLGSPQSREFLGDILKSGRHLLQLINDILDLAKVEAGKLDLRPEPIDLEIVIAEVMRIVRAISVGRNIRIDASVDPELKEGIFLDPARLKQILYNFVSNALKFTPKGGTVTLRAQPQGEHHLRLEVEDSGPGLSSEDISRLFVEFQQLDAGRAKQHSGTGLGLALTRHLAEAQGGSVGVRSAPGQGSIFHIVLPRRTAAGLVQAQIRPRPAAPGAPSVLVVEDDVRDQAQLVEALGDAGYAVEVASTGSRALALCGARKFDALSLDLLLPDMSGQELLKQVRAGGPNRDVPVVVVTVVAESGVMAGFAVKDFLPKPLDPGALLSSLARAGILPEQSGSVLVVDDDESSLRLMVATLEQLGFPTVGMHDAEEALRTLGSASPAAIVLDLVMPGMDGFEFLHRLRASPASRDTPVLVWTAKDLDAHEHARLSNSAQAIVRKGHGIPALLADLRRFLPARPRPLHGN